ncbi:hypothetical protein CsSME_00037615 [Camellia sinensis var. sinensis]
MDVPPITVIERVARLNDDRLESFWSASLCASQGGFIWPSVIQGLLAVYNTKPIGAALGYESGGDFLS